MTKQKQPPALPKEAASILALCPDEWALVKDAAQRLAKLSPGPLFTVLEDLEKRDLIELDIRGNPPGLHFRKAPAK